MRFGLVCIIAGCLFVALGRPHGSRAAELRITRVFGPEISTGPYKHPASMTELGNGDLYLVYYGGAGEYARETAVFGSRLKKGTTQWTLPKPIARDPFRSVGNGVVWEAPDGLVWLFYVVRFGETWSTSRVECKISRDHAETWSDASMLALEEGMMVRNRPIALLDGGYLLPLYHETGHDTESVGADSTSLFLKFDPATKSWSKTAPIRSPRGNIQPAVVQLDQKYLIAYCRRGGDYDPKTIGHIVRAESHDGGQNVVRGQGLAIPQSERGGRADQARERPSAVDFQRQHDPQDAADGGHFPGPGSHLADPAEYLRGPKRFRLSERVSGARRTDPPGLHVRPPHGRQPRGF